MPDTMLPTVPPEMVGIFIEETTSGTRCTLYYYAPRMKAWVKQDEFTERKLPEFMLQLAKRIMPK